MALVRSGEDNMQVEMYPGAMYDRMDGSGSGVPHSGGLDQSGTWSRPLLGLFRNRPSREVALARAADHKLYEYEREGGLPIYEKRRKFSLFASSRNIGVESVGLGLYFTFLVLLMGIMAIMSVLSIYPLVKNVLADNFARVGELQGKRTAEMEPGVKLNRTYETSNPITRMSLGNFCDNDTHSNPVYCPSRCACYIECAPEDVRMNYCWCLNPTAAATLNLKPRADECRRDNEVVVHRTKPIPVAQMWVIVTSNIIFLIWLLFLKKAQVNSAEQNNASATTAADYAVYVKGLPRSSSLSNETVAEFFTHYGEVSAVAMTFKVGELILADKELQQLEMSLNELTAKDKKGVEKTIEKESCYWLVGRLVGWLYWMYVVGSCAKGVEAEEALRAQIRRKKAYIENLKLNATPLIPMGEAIVTFNYGSHASNCMRDQHRPTYRRLYEFICCNREHPPKFLDRYRLQVTRAPEPADILWKNMDVVGANKRQRNMISFIGTATAIAAGLGIQVLLERIKEDRRQQLRIRQLQKEGSLGDFFHPLTAFAALAVLVINGIVASVVRYLTDNYERPHTRNGREKRLVWKLTMVYLVNGGILPLIAIKPRNWFVPGGLVDQAFYIQVLNAIAPFVFAIVNPYYTFVRDFLAYHCRTQEHLDKLLMPEEFIIAEQYAIVLNVLGLAFIYAPALPISNIICLGGIFLLYWTDKYVALRRCKVPKHLEEDVTNMVNLMLLMLPIAQILMAFLVYFQGLEKDQFFLPFLVGVIAWVGYFLFPFTTMFKLRREEELEDSGSGILSYREACGLREAAENDLDFTGTAQLAHYSPFFRQGLALGEEVRARYKMPREPWPGNPKLMQGQLASTGGPDGIKPPKPNVSGLGGAAAPPNRIRRAPEPPVTFGPEHGNQYAREQLRKADPLVTARGQSFVWQGQGQMYPPNAVGPMPVHQLAPRQTPMGVQPNDLSQSHHEMGVGPGALVMPPLDVPDHSQDAFSHDFHEREEDEEVLQLNRHHPTVLQQDRRESLVHAAGMIGPSGVIPHSGPQYPPQMMQAPESGLQYPPQMTQVLESGPQYRPQMTQVPDSGSQFPPQMTQEEQPHVPPQVVDPHHVPNMATNVQENMNDHTVQGYLPPYDANHGPFPRPDVLPHPQAGDNNSLGDNDLQSRVHPPPVPTSSVSFSPVQCTPYHHPNDQQPHMPPTEMPPQYTPGMPTPTRPDLPRPVSAMHTTWRQTPSGHSPANANGHNSPHEIAEDGSEYPDDPKQKND